MTENEKYIFDLFLISVKSGFESLEDIITNAIEAVEDEGWQNEISEEWIEDVLTDAAEKHLKESKSWSAETDAEKLRIVFDTLSSQHKIIALHNAGYTTSEATYDAVDVWKDLEAEGLKPRGYCYYHGQDLERVINDNMLNIGFQGSREDNDKEAIIVGNIVRDELKKAGFEVNWDNSASKRITIVNFNWQNLFTSYDDVETKWGHDRVLGVMS